jgi:hypothetical protein
MVSSPAAPAFSLAPAVPYLSPEVIDQIYDEGEDHAQE